MHTTQELLDSLKQDKINLANMLNSMGVEVSENETFTSLTPKVGKIVTKPILQDKTIEITENGIINIVADEGYDGLYNVSVNTNVASSGAEINVFIQEEEPEKKEGIWLKTSQNKPSDISINKLGLTLEWAWEKWTTPVQTAYNRVVKYKNYLYSFCGRNASNTPLDVAFRFDLKTNTAGSISSYPIAAIGPAIGIVGDKVYLFGGGITNGKTAQSYVYDIQTDTYSAISPLPVVLQQAGFVTVGTDIYIIGGSTASGYSSTTYKYDTLTDTYTTLASMPIAMATHACVYKKGYIYIFGGLRSNGYNQTCYKYDIANNKYTTITSFPVNRGHYGAGLINADIYVFGGYYGGTPYIYDVYKYDTTTDTYTKMPNMSNTWFNGGYVSDGNIIYLVNGEHLGESTDLNIVSKYGYINKKEFENDTIVLSTENDLYNTNISNNINIYFDDVIIYDSDKKTYQTTLPTYYGDGSQWIKFKN